MTDRPGPRPLDLAARAAYGAFALSSADRLGEMPSWETIPPEARADWRAVADAVQMVTRLHANPQYQQALREAVSDSWDGPGVSAEEMIEAAGERRRVSRAFLDASVAVWREIDRLDAEPEGYHPTRMSVELRQRERAAWEAYRAVLDADRLRQDGTEGNGNG